jgi:hypothetical protein
LVLENKPVAGNCWLETVDVTDQPSQMRRGFFTTNPAIFFKILKQGENATVITLNAGA